MEIRDDPEKNEIIIFQNYVISNILGIIRGQEQMEGGLLSG